MILSGVSFIAGRDCSFVVAQDGHPWQRLPRHVFGFVGVCGSGKGGFRFGE